MSNGSGKEVIKISPEVEGMQLGHPNFIGCYKKVVAKVGTEAALRLYDGMSEGKSAFICASDPRLDSFSVRWTLPRLKEIVEAGYLTRNQVLHRDMERNARYDDYYYDEWDRAEFYGPKDTVTYARWLYNRYGAGKVAKQFHVSPDFAEALGNSDLPGGIKVASLEGKVENIDAIEERIEDRHAAAFIESVWSVLKRGFYGTFHKFSIKHLQRYVDEFDFRLNDGNVKIPTDERINSVICGCWGKIMPYKTLKII